jgi:hypothetical protein
MSDRPGKDPLFGAAVLRLSFELRGATEEPGFRFVYRRTLADLGLTDDAVRAYLEEHRDAVEQHIRAGGRG